MGWMHVGDPSLVSKLAQSPARSILLQQSSLSASSPNLTQGQLSRIQIADAVRCVNSNLFVLQTGEIWGLIIQTFLIQSDYR